MEKDFDSCGGYLQHGGRGLQASGDHRHQEKVRVCDFDNLFTLYANLDCRLDTSVFCTSMKHTQSAPWVQLPAPPIQASWTFPYILYQFTSYVYICVCVFMDLFVLYTHSMTTEQELPAAASASIATLTLLISTS